jgi:hypothetical protein
MSRLCIRAFRGCSWITESHQSVAHWIRSLEFKLESFDARKIANPMPFRYLFRSFECFSLRRGKAHRMGSEQAELHQVNTTSRTRSIARGNALQAGPVPQILGVVRADGTSLLASRLDGLRREHLPPLEESRYRFDGRRSAVATPLP